MIPKNVLAGLAEKLDGTLHFDALHTALYATDASVYRRIPLAVAYPRNKEDIVKIIRFASRHKVGVIPRTAGTSLAGQCVGDGIVVDVSKYMTRIFEPDETLRTITVEPGAIRDELNTFLKPWKLFFGPNTSTSNRCMIGGMVGNNSSGTTSIQYGVTRDKVLEMEVVLTDGSILSFGAVTPEEFHEKTKLQSQEGHIYRTIHENLIDAGEEIAKEYPKPEIHRRNTGYAIDKLVGMKPFGNGEAFNMCSLLCGSEGTLAFTTRITLKLEPLPPEKRVMIAAHFNSISACCKAVYPLMKNHRLFSCEMMDKVILDCTRNNLAQQKNRFFISGDPEAILLLEIRSDSENALEAQKTAILKTLTQSGLSYAFPVLYDTDIDKAMNLRKAGLGLLGNMIGDKKAVACIEDTAVTLEDLDSYITEFSELMKKHKQKAVYYAHAGAGELHLRPVLNLKDSGDVALFKTITWDVARLVKKYGGSMSGEHGDGIVRSACIEYMIGSANYERLGNIKRAFDPNGIMNPGKIVGYEEMDKHLRYIPDRKEPEIHTYMDFSDTLGILRAAEKCNGSGDCRKTPASEGVMCPSYHATKNEKDTTRARANALREFITHSSQTNPFDSRELKDVFDLCLSCKACAKECPSSVDIASIKAEFLYQYHQSNRRSLRDTAFAYTSTFNQFFSYINPFYKAIFGLKFFKKSLGIAPKRTLPEIESFNFNKYLQNTVNKYVISKNIVLLIDEFTRYMDVETGKDTITLLCALGYKPILYFGDSGRSFLSKGFLKQAKRLANKHTTALYELLDKNTVIIGIEPSAVLTFRDEYLRLADNRNAARTISEKTYLIEEFLAAEIKAGTLTPDRFTREAREIKIHCHCHQKALSNQKSTFDMLNLPIAYKVSILSTGCCGMAGSFGYEREHYNTSMQIGELSLFPKLRNSPEAVIIAANGTSCRHQIYDGTGRKAKHPVSILKDALI